MISHQTVTDVDHGEVAADSQQMSIEGIAVPINPPRGQLFHACFGPAFHQHIGKFVPRQDMGQHIADRPEAADLGGQDRRFGQAAHAVHQVAMLADEKGAQCRTRPALHGASIAIDLLAM